MGMGIKKNHFAGGKQQKTVERGAWSVTAKRRPPGFSPFARRPSLAAASLLAGGMFLKT
jgi:hypothetical protein